MDQVDDVEHREYKRMIIPRMTMPITTLSYGSMTEVSA